MNNVMKNLFFPLFGIFPFTLKAQTPDSVQLALIPDQGANILTITITALGVSDTQTSLMTGSLETRFNLDPTTSTSDEFTIVSGDLAGTDADFTLSAGILTGGVEIRGLQASAATITPPGELDPTTGFFEADQHLFTLNRGSITGTGVASSLAQNLTETPFSSTLEGMGTVILTPSGDDFEATVTVPISITQIQPILIGVNATIEISGELTARGIIPAPASPDPYFIWATENGVSDLPENSFSLSSILPNRLVYALGYSAADVPPQVFSNTPAGVQLISNDNGLREAVEIQFTTNLMSWGTVTESQVIMGSAILPPGFNGEVILSKPEPRGFYRLMSTAPSN